MAEILLCVPAKQLAFMTANRALNNDFGPRHRRGIHNTWLHALKTTHLRACWQHARCWGYKIGDKTRSTTISRWTSEVRVVSTLAVRLGQRFERKFTGAIETRGRKNHAAGSAADVHEQAAALAPHVRKHRAIYAHRAKKIRVYHALRLFGGDRFGQPPR